MTLAAKLMVCFLVCDCNAMHAHMPVFTCKILTKDTQMITWNHNHEPQQTHLDDAGVDHLGLRLARRPGHRPRPTFLPSSGTGGGCTAIIALGVRCRHRRRLLANVGIALVSVVAHLLLLGWFAVQQSNKMMAQAFSRDTHTRGWAEAELAECRSRRRTDRVLMQQASCIFRDNGS